MSVNENVFSFFMYELTCPRPIVNLTFLIVYSEVAMEMTDMITMATA